jgi:hypothetical protein
MGKYLQEEGLAMRTSCFGCKNYQYDIVFHSPTREGRCSIHGWVKFWFPACNEEAEALQAPPPQPQEVQIGAAFYSPNKNAIKAKIKQAGLSYLRDFGRGDMSRWGYGGNKGEIIFHRVGENITVTVSSAELLDVLKV